MARFFRRRKFCRFTEEGVQEIDYKDVATLKNYITLLTNNGIPETSINNEGREID